MCRVSFASMGFVAALTLTACGAGTPSSQPLASSPSAVVTARPSASAQPSLAPAVPAPRVIAVTVAGGTVTGVDSRVAASLGEQLVIRVTSDVADEVHLHGYDLRADVAAGGTVDIPLTATIAGGFEVELEGSGQTLFQLRVS